MKSKTKLFGPKMSDFGEEIEVEIFEEEIDEEPICIETTISVKPVARELKGSERRSKPILGKLAISSLLARRANQLHNKAPTTLPFDKRVDTDDINTIAKKELDLKVIPLRIIRRFDDGTYEYWRISEFLVIDRDCSAQGGGGKRTKQIK